MIKIPGTREGWPAIERSLRDGISITITLLFSVEHYRAVPTHGRLSRTLNDGEAIGARRVMDALADVNRTLEDEGIEKFVKSFDAVLKVIARKRQALVH